ncbi:tRNA (5-methylaminomethyl-2-thiouridine)(34)-methyltransferase MnmD [Olivibacter sitiensis]|uniref:tRNA (5-methylaminomethyl-2-thiouridine)(34)-methyltransferase MnmD n=1 Tax=Olivibacter sitiensis TaxID=376470 RepID=UPI00040778DC|nr:tRNA (5-methylaminomethyl-2-thiouridine)(34)-methyltransferase MnmD [Olivibacter sitiensis]
MEFVVTGDGSKTLYHAEIGEHYHSRHGAVQESRHVFLEAGLKDFLKQSGAKELSVLEVGFGTGLNFLLSAQYTIEHSISFQYKGIEAYPLPIETIGQTGYDTLVSPALWEHFMTHYSQAQHGEIPWPGARLSWEIAHSTLLDFHSTKRFDVVYFDAFAAVHQPEMWNDEALAHVAEFLRPQGLFVTYAITGKLKRSLKALGFTIEKLPGAPGKREMLRATKL